MFNTVSNLSTLACSRTSNAHVKMMMMESKPSSTRVLHLVRETAKPRLTSRPHEIACRTQLVHRGIYEFADATIDTDDSQLWRIVEITEK